MRKCDREITDIKEIEEIIKSATICRLALCSNNKPYIVPMCFGYKNKTLYFHCALEGKKTDILKQNPNVCFEIEGDCKIIGGDQACKWTMDYKSVVGNGKAVFVISQPEKIKALDIFMSQYCKEKFNYPSNALKKTAMIKVVIEEMTGKKSK
ncbi:MAG TPA: pyridoxamine 5'-phosphate oxidase family protein [Elusimicrobiales bacterium]|nr:pyridoxamine 5'-phosphate oxidase family protein [Elusimicrobiales bacterium]